MQAQSRTQSTRRNRIVTLFLLTFVVGTTLTLVADAQAAARKPADQTHFRVEAARNFTERTYFRSEAARKPADRPNFRVEAARRPWVYPLPRVAARSYTDALPRYVVAARSISTFVAWRVYYANWPIFTELP